MTSNDLLKKAISELDNLQSDEIFIVRDLFKGYVWNRAQKNERLRVGILFLNEVVSGILSQRVKIVEKTKTNQQKYQKK